jgi:hypothetical protein
MPRQLIPNSALPPRYGKTSESIRRWKRDPNMNFPKPAAIIAGRAYFDEAELEAWETRFEAEEPTT